MNNNIKTITAMAGISIATTLATNTVKSENHMISNNVIPKHIKSNSVKLLANKEVNSLENQTFITGEQSNNLEENKSSTTVVSFNTNNMRIYVNFVTGVASGKFILYNKDSVNKSSIYSSNDKIYFGNGWNRINKDNPIYRHSFSYGDVLEYVPMSGVVAGIKNGGNPLSFDNYSMIFNGSSNSNMNYYFRITKEGLKELKGFQTIGEYKYYFNPTTGAMETGWQTIDGSKYYFNADGTMQLGWQTRNNTTWYYLNPQTGVMETGWQTIDGNKYYFNPETGIMQTGVKKIDGSVYDFSPYGNLIGKVTVAIDGANNKTINLGSQFNPLEGITLNDIADPTAKIEVSGAVNTNIPGVYKLTYKVTDSYGQTATATREIVVRGSNTEDIYWDYSSVVINGNIILNNKEVSKNTPKEIIIKDSKGNVVASINTVAVNWYSKDKDSYSGYQGIVTSGQLSKLEPSESYNIYIKMDGTEIPIANKLVLKSNIYTVESNKDGNLMIKNNLAKLENEAVYETDYFTDYGYVLNGNLYLDNTIFNKSDSKMLVIKDMQGNIVDKVRCASMNWYTNDKDNYSGFQGIFTNSELSKLKAGEQYIFELEINKNGKTYTFPIKNARNFILNTGVDYNIETNLENNLIISKKVKNGNISLAKGTLEDGYWQPYGYVMNIKADLNEEIPKGTEMELISKNSSGQVVSVTKGVDVNWYSNNKENYDGFQAIITPNQLKNISKENKLYARVILGGEVKEFPINGVLNTSTKKFDYRFKTIDDQIYLISDVDN